jgi:hypothetical protein
MAREGTEDNEVDSHEYYDTNFEAEEVIVPTLLVKAVELL